MNKLSEIIHRKPLIFLILSLGYLLLIGFIKWHFAPPVWAIGYLAGGAIGVYFLDAAEVFFVLNPSPFRSIVFCGAFVVVSLFIATSSVSFMAQGLVLSLYLSLILWQIGEWQYTGNLNSWYRMIATPVTRKTEQWGIVAFILLFLIETALFIAWA